jgi:hypothetical protein
LFQGVRGLECPVFICRLRPWNVRRAWDVSRALSGLEQPWWRKNLARELINGTDIDKFAGFPFLD